MTGQKIIDGLNEALNLARGDDQPAAVHVVHVRPMTMVERCARAMLADDLKGMNRSFEEVWVNEKAIWMSNARAAIAAMREPTEGMIEAGNDECEPGCGFNADRPYQAMIQAALAEGER